jgi:hypothetical protein
MKKNIIIQNFLDPLIYKISKKRFVYEKLKFKKYLSTKKKQYISNFDPIIIGGCPRSGTTLAHAIISTHPDLASPIQEYNILMWINKDKILKDVFNFKIDEIKYLKNTYKDHIMLAENILKLYTKKEGKKQISLKHPFHILIIDDLFHFFPNMRFINVIRDGRDVACSLKTHPKRKIVDGKIVQLNTKNSFKWCIRRWVVSIKQSERWKNHSNYFEVKYENLVNQPEKTMVGVFKFLNLEKIPKEKLDAFYKSQVDEKHLQNIEVGKPIYKKAIGRWEKDMSIKEKKLFKKLTGDLLIQLGYEKFDKW